MDVINVEQAIIAEKAGACAVMALERVPADIRKNGMYFRLCPVRSFIEQQDGAVVVREQDPTTTNEPTGSGA